MMLLIPILIKARRSKTKVVFGVHNPNFFSFSKIKVYSYIYKRLIFNVPNFHVLNGEDYKKLLDLDYKGNIYYIPNFLYYKRNEMEKIHVNRNEFIILFVGRLEANQKGLDFLQKIIEITLEYNKNIVYHIVGSGNDATLIYQLTLKFPNNVKYMGFLPGAELEEEYNKASLFILTSRIEAFSLVSIEAQAHGLPVIAFKIKGPKDIIVNEFQGELIEPFNVKKFADAIVKYYLLWASGKIDEQYKSKIRDYIFNKYSPGTILPKIRAMLSP